MNSAGFVCPVVSLHLILYDEVVILREVYIAEDMINFHGLLLVFDIFALLSSYIGVRNQFVKLINNIVNELQQWQFQRVQVHSICRLPLFKFHHTVIIIFMIKVRKH